MSVRFSDNSEFGGAAKSKDAVSAARVAVEDDVLV
jgi:hypothetical protein